MNDYSKLIGNTSLSVSEAMQAIDKNANGILFLTNEKSRLIACITDGDIRRYLLAGGSMNDNAIDAANHTPKTATSIEEARLLYNKRDYIAIPIVNGDNIITDIFNDDINGDKNERPVLGIPVVINAGGKGTRLEPFTKVLPKPLIPVGELPIIELIMKEYQSYKCEDFHIIVNYKKDLIKAYFHDIDSYYNILWYDEEKPLGTGGGISLLKGKINGTFIFSNCDALLTADYAAMLKFHREQKNDITMVCVCKNVNIPYGVVKMGEDGGFEGMTEKPLIPILTNTGTYIVEPNVINDVADGESIGFPEIIEREKEKGCRVGVFSVNESDWMDMGQLPELEKMRVKLYGE